MYNELEIVKDEIWVPPKGSKEYVKLRIANQLRIHWGWLKNKNHKEVYEFIENIIDSSY